MSVKLREPKPITADKVLKPEAIKPGFTASGRATRCAASRGSPETASRFSGTLL